MAALQIPHFCMVDKTTIEARFFDRKRHRATLFLPFAGRGTGKVLCVIGQNPSVADECFADKTIHYLEKLIYCKHAEYAALLILNLYSRVDKKKSATNNLLHSACVDAFNCALNEYQDFLLVYGKPKNQGAYRFPERAKLVMGALKGKKVFQLGTDTDYPPHPGNPKILYRNFDISLAPLRPHDRASR